MGNIDLPVEGVLPGDPDALRAAANAARALTETRGRAASDQAQAARSSAAGGWSGPAAEAFDAAASNGRARIDALVAVIPDLPGPVLTYADTLEALRREYVQVQAQAQDLAARIATTPSAGPGADPVTADALGDSYFAASDRLDAILIEAADADRAAAAAVTALAGRLSDPQTTAAQHALTVGLSTVGLGSAAKVEQVEREIGPTTTGNAFKVFGRVLGPVGAGLGQALADEANPNYSTAERIGRATAKALVVGVPATAVGAALAVPAGAAGATLGPVGAFVGAAGGAYVGSTAATGFVNSLPFTDDAIDGAGELFDWFGEQMRPLPTHPDRR